MPCTCFSPIKVDVIVKLRVTSDNTPSLLPPPRAPLHKHLWNGSLGSGHVNNKRTRHVSPEYLLRLTKAKTMVALGVALTVVVVVVVGVA